MTFEARRGVTKNDQNLVFESPLNLSYGHPKGGGRTDQKIAIFDDFSNFLQGIRYCLGYQNSLNETYLTGSG